MPRLPAHPDLAQYKKQAKDLLAAARAGDAEAKRRIEAARSRAGNFILADAQLAIAREHAFESWPRFAQHIESLAGAPSPRAVYKAAADAVIAGDVRALERLLDEHPKLLREEHAPAYVPSGPGPHYGKLDARTIIAREQRFENWDEYEAFLRARGDESSQVARFETAVEAVITGDVTLLAQLLEADPTLIHTRSLRTHHSQLLHYIGANGIEGFRQKTPNNAVAVLELLLDSGAEINAEAGMYGGTTTLGLVATSIHPQLAGVQDALIATLLERGATFANSVAPDYTSGNLVNACLANGRPQAAELLAQRGAPLDLEGAAGVGRLDVVKTFFTKDGELTNATEQQ